MQKIFSNYSLWLSIIPFLIFIVFSLIIFSNWLVINRAKGLTFDDVAQIKENKVGLVLGTIKNLENGRINLYFKYRMDAAELLFKQGKVKYLIVSGDNSHEGYNEPLDMKQDLMSRGIPEDKIFADYAGFRTLDSIVRAKEIFQQNSFTIISQKFHNERAIFISQAKGFNVIGFNAQDVNKIDGLSVQIREYLARVKVLIDIYIINQQPKFLGEKIKIK
ncbi:MAG: YdcF family protein [Candidatus Sericytochromatia bacterium]|nr:YdcF family protein [Candidatus Sericytochromatia bacterium]